MYCHAVLILCKDRIVFFIIKYLVHEFDIYHGCCYNSTKYICTHFEDILHYSRSSRMNLKKLHCLSAFSSWLHMGPFCPDSQVQFPQRMHLALNSLLNNSIISLQNTGCLSGAWKKRSILRIIEKRNTRSEHSNKCLMVTKTFASHQCPWGRNYYYGYVPSLIRSKEKIKSRSF